MFSKLVATLKTMVQKVKEILFPKVILPVTITVLIPTLLVWHLAVKALHWVQDNQLAAGIIVLAVAIRGILMLLGL